MKNMSLKLSTIAVSIKLITSLFISYLVLFRGDAGYLVHNIGTFMVAGNYIIGLSALLNVTLLYVVILYNLFAGYKSLLKIQRTLLFGDIILVIINLVLGIYISCVYYQMPLPDAQYKFVILADGSAVVYYITSLVIALLITKNQTQSILDYKIDNNPLSFNGRMGRLPYFITKLSLLVIFVLIGIVIYLNNQSEYLIILVAIFTFVFFTIGLFAANKRLRDINWNQWLLLIWAIPYLGLFIGIPLLFIKSKPIKD